ncbi:MAG: hypothetical protein KAT29_09410, partial [Anaerolineales bacterium]|nr:hypothetical protein [Anaerolineales bacterium]
NLLQFIDCTVMNLLANPNINSTYIQAAYTSSDKLHRASVKIFTTQRKRSLHGCSSIVEFVYCTMA